MKLRFNTWGCLFLIGMLLFVCGSAVAEERTSILLSRVLESFDQAETGERTWQLMPSKYGYDMEGKSLWEKRYVENWPEALFGKNKEQADLKVLGLRGSFLRKGFNHVELIPGKGTGDNFVAEPIPIPGRAQTIDLWVWGSNHNYYLEVHVRDFRGVVHVLPLGNIKYIGWKNLSTEFPPTIPQSWGYLPAYRQLAVTKLVLWTRPEEKVDNFFVYLDHVKVLTDIFEAKYDGDSLADLDRVNEIWGTASE